jgi:hypothetical protein
MPDIPQQQVIPVLKQQPLLPSPLELPTIQQQQQAPDNQQHEQGAVVSSQPQQPSMPILEPTPLQSEEQSACEQMPSLTIENKQQPEKSLEKQPIEQSKQQAEQTQQPSDSLQEQPEQKEQLLDNTQKPADETQPPPSSDDIFDAVRESKVTLHSGPSTSKIEFPSASSPAPATESTSAEDAAPQPVVHSAGQMPTLLSNPDPEPIKYIVGTQKKSEDGEEGKKQNIILNDDDDDHNLPDLEMPMSPVEEQCDTKENTKSIETSNDKQELKHLKEDKDTNIPLAEKPDAKEKEVEPVKDAEVEAEPSSTIAATLSTPTRAPPVLEEQPKPTPPEKANIEKIIPESDSDTDSKSSSSSSSSDDSDSDDSSSSSSSSSSSEDEGEAEDKVDQDDIEVGVNVYISHIIYKHLNSLFKMFLSIFVFERKPFISI